MNFFLKLKVMLLAISASFAFNSNRSADLIRLYATVSRIGIHCSSFAYAYFNEVGSLNSPSFSLSRAPSSVGLAFSIFSLSSSNHLDEGSHLLRPSPFTRPPHALLTTPFSPFLNTCPCDLMLLHHCRMTFICLRFHLHRHPRVIQKSTHLSPLHPTYVDFLLKNLLGILLSHI